MAAGLMNRGGLQRVQLQLIATLLLAAALACPNRGDGADSPRKLNVLLIVADDLNCSLGCYGHPIVKSPNLDRLAASGVRFERAYCNYPVCNASRTSFLSGRRPDSTGVWDQQTPPRTHLQDAVMLGEHFRRHGYTTVSVGKIFHQPSYADPRSWDIDIPEKGTATNPPAQQILRQPGVRTIVLRARDEDTWDGFVARKSAGLMEGFARTEKPFLIAVGFRRPHLPNIAPEKYYALYDPRQLEVRPGPPEHLANIPDLALTYKLGARAFPEGAAAGETMAGYFAAISFLDAQVGVLLEAMDRLKLWDNTVVIFLSDNGFHNGEHGGLWQKMCLFEETTRVPLIVAAPGRAKNSPAGGMIELVDLFPTLTELCGLPQPGALEGTSFVPLLDAPNRRWKRAVFTVVARGDLTEGTKAAEHLFGPHRERTVLTEDGWRYTKWHDGSSELYNHNVDPCEYANLAKTPEAAVRLADLQKLLSNGWKAARPD